MQSVIARNEAISIAGIALFLTMTEDYQVLQKWDTLGCNYLINYKVISHF
jgi:hypothetical protein